jgi:hypothetical protein
MDKQVKDMVENLLNIDINENNFKLVYESLWNDKDFQNRNPLEMCLLHYYRQNYYTHLRKSNEDLKFTNRVIYRTCIQNNINPDKIFDCSSITGELKPQKFERYIDVDKIPEFFNQEYEEIYKMVQKAKVSIREEDKEYEKHLNEIIEKYPLFNTKER